MPRFPVTETKQKDLLERMERVGLREADLEEIFVRAGGSGGQKINKTSASVHIRDRKSGVEVRCQESRSQALNRFIARRRLVEKLEARILRKQSAEQKRREKIRRQKRKRSKRAKEKMLAEKKKRGETKALRKKPATENDS